MYSPRRNNVNLMLLAALVLLVTLSSTGWSKDAVVRLSEPVAITATHETFGAPFPDGARTLSLEALLSDAEHYLDREVTLEARVAQVCQKKGCFFIAQQGAFSARISFKDYGFFVPSNISGRTVALHGALVERELSPQQARHLNEDAGSGAVIAPGRQYEIVATSVRVPLL